MVFDESLLDPAPRRNNQGSKARQKRVERRVRDSSFEQLGPQLWRLSCIPSLGDNYDYYDVDLKANVCTCEGHDKGQFRRFCTHKQALKLYLAANPGVETTVVPTDKVGDPKEVLIQQTQQPQIVMEVEHSPLIPRLRYPGLMFPSWLKEFRDFQPIKIDEIFEQFEVGNRNVYLHGPTGSGKTAIAWGVHQRFAKKYPSFHSYYLSDTIHLQNQFINLFGEVGAKKIIGRRHFTPIIPVDEYEVPVTCEDCDKRGGECSYCPEVVDCPYNIAKKSAASAPVAVANYAYALNEWRSFSDFRDADLVICDEGDVLEDKLLDLKTIEITQRMRNGYGITQPRVLGSTESQIDFIRREVLVKLKAGREKVKGQGVRATRERLLIGNRMAAFKELAEDLEHSLTEEDPIHKWVLTGYEPGRGHMPRQGPLTWKPIVVKKFAHDLLWNNGKRFLIMSASLVSSDVEVDSTGFDGKYETVVAPMPFPIENREIHAFPVAQVTRKNEAAAIPKIQYALTKICSRFPTKRILIHSVSYAWRDHLLSTLKGTRRPVFTYNASEEKDEAIEEFKRTPHAILIGPSFKRGVDFKGEEAEVNIIFKAPWPSLGDARVQARAYKTGPSGRRWYAMQAIREIIQMTGRTTRDMDDKSVTFILDATVVSLMQDYRSFFPDWWLEAYTYHAPSQIDYLDRIQFHV